MYHPVCGAVASPLITLCITGRAKWDRGLGLANSVLPGQLAGWMAPGGPIAPYANAPCSRLVLVHMQTEGSPTARSLARRKSIGRIPSVSALVALLIAQIVCVALRVRRTFA